MTTAAEVLSRLGEVLAKTTDQMGVGFTGVFNIESGFAEVRTEMFDHCQWCDFGSNSCEKCGREPGKSLSFRTGPGDGVYAGLGFWGDTSGEHQVACVYLFDDEYASLPLVNGDGSTTADSRRFYDYFFKAAAPYLTLPAYDGGTINTGADGFWIGERASGTNSGNALVDHWGSQNKTYRALLFCEPLTPQSTPTKSGKIGAEPSPVTSIHKNAPLRPRMLIMIEEHFLPRVIPPPEDAESVDWPAQGELAPDQLVRSHVAGVNMNLGAMKCMAMHWWQIREIHKKRAGADDPRTVDYARVAFSWAVQGAAHGLDIGPQAVGAFLRAEPRLSDLELLREGLRIRGQELTDDIVRLVGAV